MRLYERDRRTVGQLMNKIHLYNLGVYLIVISPPSSTEGFVILILVCTIVLS
jgi:hypothetical protein